MSAVLIPCPNCGKALKLRDRSLLGRKGKCPSCEHRFVLEEPEEVALELVDTAAPAVGTAAQWVPDEPAARTSPPIHAAVSEQVAVPALADDGAARIRELQRRNARRRNTGLVVGALLAVGIGAVVYAVRSYVPEPARNDPKPPPTVNAAYQAQQQTLRTNAETAKSLSPTSGEAIRLLYSPAGASIVINVRPARLWRDAEQFTEFRYALGEPLVPWIESKIREICLFDPSQIEEALFSIMLGPRGSQPEVAAVVRMAEAPRPSELILRIQSVQQSALPSTQQGMTLFKGESRAFLLVDEKTFATAPVRMADDLLESIRHPALTQPSIEETLLETDRERHLTIVFPPTDTRIHLKALVPEIARPAFDRLCLWLGDDVEAVAWSMHLGPEQFFSEFVLRNQHAREQMVVTPGELRRRVDRRLQQLPEELLAAVQKMEPTEYGRRRIVGRFPAMMQAYALATLSGIGDRSVRLTTILPERAAPNLVLGALLTWDESTRTDFSKEAPSPIPASEKLPERLADRLKKPIEIDFRRTPLQDAVGYIGDETSVHFEIDGNALKLGGMTQNMPQTFAMGVVPAEQALQRILKNYEKEGLCVVLDEPARTARLTTRAAATEKGLTPHEFSRTAPVEP